MKYKKSCRNCEYVMTGRCKGCNTTGENKFENFVLRRELIAEAKRRKEIDDFLTLALIGQLISKI